MTSNHARVAQPDAANTAAIAANCAANSDGEVRA